MANKRLNLEGRRFGRLVAVKDTGLDKNHSRVWRCKCDCGNEKDIPAARLNLGRLQSCGCALEEARVKVGKSNAQPVEGVPKTQHPLYQTWVGMISRCSNPFSTSYKYYGGRGIQVCDRWKDFSLFVEDMGPRPEGHTLDRVDNDGGYTPENCRWATHQEQGLNRKPYHEWDIKGDRYGDSRAETTR